MKIFLAGATGAIGTRLLPILVRAGHTVTGTTRHPGKAAVISSAGAIPVVLDALDAKQVRDAVHAAQPDVIIHQLTALPNEFDIRHFDREFAVTNRLRTEATDHLLAEARTVGCSRFIAQSYAGWPYERTGGWIKTEEDPLLTSPAPILREALAAIVHVESSVLGESGMKGFVLRYGAFYGPGTSLGLGGPMLEAIRRRRLPLVGKATGYWSFIHIDDAAAATLAAVAGMSPGIFNIVDDEPAPVSAWLPFLAGVLGARPPWHLPVWLARMAMGEHGVAMMTEGRGASNRKAKSLLPWKPRWPTWRVGFRDGLGNDGLGVAVGRRVA